MVLKPNDFFSDDIFISPVDQDCLTENLVLTSNIEVLLIPVDSLIPHPLSIMTYQPKPIFQLKLSISLVRQIHNITVKRGNNGKYEIIDGMSRFLAAQELNMKTLKCDIVDVDDSYVPLLRSQINIHLPKSWKEKIIMMDEFLKRIGSCQGKKRDLKEILEICEEGKIPVDLRDRYDIVRTVFDFKMSVSTIRKAHAVYLFDRDGNEEIKGLGLMNKIDDNLLSIDSAYKIRENFLKSKELQGELNALEEIEYYQEEVSFQLFNKPCEDILEYVPEKSVNTVIFSPPYYDQREYPFGINDLNNPKIGNQKKREDYINDLVNIIRLLKHVLTTDGNLFINIADSYSKGYCLNIISHLVVEMEKDGWFLVQPLIWLKTNPKPQGRIKRLRPSTETILHFCLDPEKRYYRELKIYDREKLFSIITGCNDETKNDKIQSKKKYSLKTNSKSLIDFLDSQTIEGIIKGSVVNKSKLKKIDPNCSHLAPAPDYLSIYPTLTTTKPGDTILDIFAGTSNLLSFPFMMRRNVIGFDTDPRSIDFSFKHLSYIGQNMFTDKEIFDIENEIS